METQAGSSWENLLLGVFAILILFWVSPGIKAALAKSKAATPDWPAVLWPMVTIVLFVLALIAMVKK
jgi:hypothetical protein